jgi:hypothetical protein
MNKISMWARMSNAKSNADARIRIFDTMGEEPPSWADATFGASSSLMQ